MIIVQKLKWVKVMIVNIIFSLLLPLNNPQFFAFILLKLYWICLGRSHLIVSFTVKEMLFFIVDLSYSNYIHHVFIFNKSMLNRYKLNEWVDNHVRPSTVGEVVGELKPTVSYIWGPALFLISFFFFFWI